MKEHAVAQTKSCLNEGVQLGHVFELGIAVEQQGGVVAAGVALLAIAGDQTVS